MMNRAIIVALAAVAILGGAALLAAKPAPEPCVGSESYCEAMARPSPSITWRRIYCENIQCTK